MTSFPVGHVTRQKSIGALQSKLDRQKYRFLSCSCGYEMMKGSLSWQLHLVRNLSWQLHLVRNLSHQLYCQVKLSREWSNLSLFQVKNTNSPYIHLLITVHFGTLDTSQWWRSHSHQLACLSVQQDKTFEHCLPDSSVLTITGSECGPTPTTVTAATEHR